MRFWHGGGQHPAVPDLDLGLCPRGRAQLKAFWVPCAQPQPLRGLFVVPAPRRGVHMDSYQLLSRLNCFPGTSPPRWRGVEAARTPSRRDRRAGRDQPQPAKQRYGRFQGAWRGGGRLCCLPCPYLSASNTSNLQIQSPGAVGWCWGCVIAPRLSCSLQLPAKSCEVGNYRTGDGWQGSLLALWRNWKGSFPPLFANSFPCQG